MKSVMQSFKNMIRNTFQIGLEGFKSDYTGSVEASGSKMNSINDIRKSIRNEMTQKRSIWNMVGIDDDIRDQGREMGSFLRNLTRKNYNGYDLYGGGDDPWDYSNSDFDEVSSSNAKGGFQVDTTGAQASIKGAEAISKSIGAAHKDAMTTSRFLNRSLTKDLSESKGILKEILAATQNTTSQEKTYQYYAESLILLKEMSMDLKTGLGINPVTGELEMEDVGAGRFAKKLASGDIVSAIGDLKNVLSGMGDQSGMMTMGKSLLSMILSQYTGTEGIKNLIRSGMLMGAKKLGGKEAGRKMELLMDDPSWFFEEVLQGWKGSGNKFKRAVGNRLSNNLGTPNDTTMKSDPRQRMFFDKATHTTINLLIPELLEDIRSALTGTKARAYDYTENKWKTRNDIIGEFQQKKPTLLFEGGDFERVFTDYFKDHGDSQTKKDLLIETIDAQGNKDYKLKNRTNLNKLFQAIITSGIGIFNFINGDAKALVEALGLKELTYTDVKVYQDLLRSLMKDKDSEAVFSELEKQKRYYMQELRDYIKSYKVDSMFNGTLGLFTGAFTQGFVDDSDYNTISMINNMSTEARTKAKGSMFNYGLMDMGGFGGSRGSNSGRNFIKNKPEINQTLANIAVKDLKDMTIEERQKVKTGFDTESYMNAPGYINIAEEKANKELNKLENEAMVNNYASKYGVSPEDLKKKYILFDYFKKKGATVGGFTRFAINFFESAAKKGNPRAQFMVESLKAGKINSAMDIDLNAVSNDDMEKAQRLYDKGRTTKNTFDTLTPIDSAISVSNELWADDALKSKFKLGAFAGSTAAMSMILKKTAKLGPLTSPLVAAGIMGSMAFTGKLDDYSNILFGEAGNEKIGDQTRRAALIQKLVTRYVPAFMAGSKVGGATSRILTRFLGGHLGKVLGPIGGILVGTAVTGAMSSGNWIMKLLSMGPQGRLLRKLPVVGKYFNKDREDMDDDTIRYGKGEWIGAIPLEEATEEMKADDANWKKPKNAKERREYFKENKVEFDKFSSDLHTEMNNILANVASSADIVDKRDTNDAARRKLSELESERETLKKWLNDNKSQSNSENWRLQNIRYNQLLNNISAAKKEVEESQKMLDEAFASQTELNKIYEMIGNWVNSKEGRAYIAAYQNFHNYGSYTYAQNEVVNQLKLAAISGDSFFNKIKSISGAIYNSTKTWMDNNLKDDTILNYVKSKQEEYIINEEKSTTQLYEQARAKFMREKGITSFDELNNYDEWNQNATKIKFDEMIIRKEKRLNQKDYADLVDEAANKEREQATSGSGLSGKGKGTKLKHYSQNDSKFRDKNMRGSDSKLSEYGCAVMVAATLLSALYGDMPSDDIDGIIQYANKFTSGDGGIEWGFFRDLIERIGADYTTIIPEKSNPEEMNRTIKSTLRKKDGYAIVLLEEPSKHWILLTGMNGDKVIVSDPDNKSFTESSLGDILSRSSLIIKVDNVPQGVFSIKGSVQNLVNKAKSKVNNIIKPFKTGINTAKSVYGAIKDPRGTWNRASRGIKDVFRNTSDKISSTITDAYSNSPLGNASRLIDNGVLRVKVEGGNLDSVKTIGVIGAIDKTAYDVTMNKMALTGPKEGKAAIRRVKNVFYSKQMKEGDRRQDITAEAMEAIVDGKFGGGTVKEKKGGGLLGFLGNAIGGKLLGGLSAGAIGKLVLGTAATAASLGLAAYSAYKLKDSISNFISEDGDPSSIGKTRALWKGTKGFAKIFAKTKGGKKIVKTISGSILGKVGKGIVNISKSEAVKVFSGKIMQFLGRILKLLMELLPNSVNKFLTKIVKTVGTKIAGLGAKAAGKESAKLAAWTGPQAIVTGLIVAGSLTWAFFSGRRKASELLGVAESEVTPTMRTACGIGHAIYDALTWIPFAGIGIALFSNSSWICKLVYSVMKPEDKKKVETREKEVTDDQKDEKKQERKIDKDNSDKMHQAEVKAAGVNTSAGIAGGNSTSDSTRRPSSTNPFPSLSNKGVALGAAAGASNFKWSGGVLPPPNSLIAIATNMVDRHEGFRSKPYRDSLKYLTVGHGFLIEKDKSPFSAEQVERWTKYGISKEESMAVLQNHVMEIDQHFSKNYPWYNKLDDGRKAAIIDLGYNMGKGWLEKFDRTKNFLASGNFEEAGKSILINSKGNQTLYSKQVGYRANEMASLLATGQVNSRYIPKNAVITTKALAEDQLKESTQNYIDTKNAESEAANRELANKIVNDKAMNSNFNNMSNNLSGGFGNVVTPNIKLETKSMEALLAQILSTLQNQNKGNESDLEFLRLQGIANPGNQNI